MPSFHAFRTFTNSLLTGRAWRSTECPFTATVSRNYSSSSSSSSSKRWLNRQQRDQFSKEAKVKGLKSRAAFKLLQINDKYRLFKRGMTVVDLGYAPGSWSQVAVDRTSPGGRVVGVDIIPALPPKGASTIQGNFLSPAVQASIRTFLSDPDRGRPRERKPLLSSTGETEGYIDQERRETLEPISSTTEEQEGGKEEEERAEKAKEKATVDVVLSDMSEPWPLTNDSSWKRSLTDPWRRMMNTSGISFRDHAGSMDLCNAALLFCLDVLKPGGSFVCKFYQGAEDKILETRLRRVFEKVHRDKPESSRKESKEQYFVALKMRPGVDRSVVLAE